MEKLGFVKTEKDGRDARRSLAALTTQGAELVTDAAGVLDDALGETLEEVSFTAQDQKQLQKVLVKLRS